MIPLSKDQISSQSHPSSDEGRLHPLSYAQQRLWLIYQIEPDTPGYNLPLGLRLKGALNTAALEESLHEILRRHDVLRTCFIVRHGEPFQKILPTFKFQLATLNFSHIPGEQQEEEVRKATQAEARKIFDLEHGPVFRATLLRISEHDHVLLITMHHIVSDGWSIGVLLQELIALYIAFSQGQPSPLPDLPMQYADFAEWQRGWLTGETLEKQLSYWRRQLSNLPPPLELPVDRAQAQKRSFNGNSYRFSVPADVAEKLRRLARGNKASLFMVLLAAWQVLLHRYSGQTDILIGTAIANRNRLQLEKLIGFFVNTLVLRADLSGDLTFIEVLHRAREASLAAQEYQDLPFEKLVAELEPQRKANENPFFRVMFSYLNLPVSEIELAGLRWEHLEQTITVSRFDLMLTVFEAKAELPALFEYSADLFDESTIVRLADHFRALLVDIVTYPQQKIHALRFLSTKELEQVLVEWAGTETEYPRGSSVCELFEQQAEQTPEAVALVFQNKKLSYRELNGKANQFARHLRSNGIQLEDRIAVFMDGSAELIITLLGILKSGAAYVALDLNYPADRIAFILADTKTTFLITHKDLKKNLPEEISVKVLCIDQGWPEIEQSSSSDLKLPLSSGNLAYIAYTSGSTGFPKGAAISHRAVVRLVRGNNYARFGPQEIFLQFAPAAFDASTFEIWGCLLNGAKLMIVPARPAGIEELSATLEQQQVTTAWLTAGLFHWMADHHLDVLSAVPQLLAGGDVLSKSHVEKFLDANEGPVLINGYGPTESTTFTCCHPVKKGDQLATSVPVGKPVANTQVYVLDPQMQPVPIAAPGELFIGGDGLARGYWERADLTAEKFVPNPYSKRPGERLYRSGDRMRWLANGTLEFLGRMDAQVKIRGYRVEPGEIEAALRSHSMVHEAAVIAKAQSSGEKYLATYFSAEIADDITAEELRQYLQARLPDYMVPSIFVPVKELPLTANGKVDRKALADLPVSELPGTSHTPPRTAIEKIIAQVWSEVLEKTFIGIEDDFFELGGHSLLATQIVSRLCDVFQVEDIPLHLLFESPTVASLSDSLKQLYDPETLEVIAEAFLEAQDLTPDKIEKLLS